MTFRSELDKIVMEVTAAVNDFASKENEGCQAADH